MNNLVNLSFTLFRLNYLYKLYFIYTANTKTKNFFNFYIAEPAEEIIAEDYDETTPSKDTMPKPYIPAEKDYEFDLDINFKIKGYESCPNKYNIYHDCSHYCVKKWKNGRTEPDVKYLEKKMKMLMKYPLPDNWQEVYDKGVLVN